MIQYLSSVEFKNLIGPALISFFGYLITRALARVDSHTKNQNHMMKELGKLEMINKAQWLQIDDLKKQIAEVRGVIYKKN